MSTSRPAAQYIRMSTDNQELSPSLQKEAICAYATARGFEIIASYEDEGRSGIHLKNRPGLQRLLRDVTEPGHFSTVLVYDVSRWGRFQDADAAAYYEYHCRLHGVEVVYVAEIFGADINPITALLKSMKRAMAAEYSRELANKARAGQHQVVCRGNQLGPLPALGFRRCSVSADGKERVMLADGQRKLAATDRIEWVAATQSEVELVIRICHLYARTRLSFSDIARLGSMEGWRDHKARPISAPAIAALLRNEALIGNFVWGRTKHAGSLFSGPPSRHDGAVPRLVDDELWAMVQRRMAIEISKQQSDEQVAAKLVKVLQREPLITTRDLRAQGLPSKVTLRTRFGAWPDILRRAGADPDELHRKMVDRAKQRMDHVRLLGRALVERLREEGHQVTFDGRLNVLRFVDFGMRLRLLWPTLGDTGALWRIRVERTSRGVDFDLVVRMENWFRPSDYFVVPSAELMVRFPHWLPSDVPIELLRFWSQSPEALLKRIRTISERSLENSAGRSRVRRAAVKVRSDTAPNREGAASCVTG